MLSATVGVLGCSNTQDATAGYHRYTNLATLWSDRDLQGYGGKCVVDWANPASPTWRNFGKGLTRYAATDRIWWQICTHVNEGAAQQHADDAYNILRTKTSLPVYVSPMDLTVTCLRSDEVISQQMCESLIGRGLALPGPTLSALGPTETVDGCHATVEASLIWGRELSDFFD